MVHGWKPPFIYLFIYLFVVRIVHEVQKHSTLQYKSTIKIEQEYKQMHCMKKNYLGRHNVDSRFNLRMAEILDK